ncbi:MAG TPA: hypothetical protein ACN46L_02965 [Prochlorococcus sp.]
MTAKTATTSLTSDHNLAGCSAVSFKMMNPALVLPVLSRQLLIAKVMTPLQVQALKTA